MIGPELAALLESGVITFIGTVDAYGSPSAAHAFGIQVLDGGGRIRVTVNGEDTEMLENLRTTGTASIGATDVPTLRSVQLKGRAGLIAAPDAAVRIRIAEHRAALFGTINETDGTPIELLDRMVPREFVTVVVDVDEIYDQTPGPQAGASLTSGAA